jgi:hypothetical protein
MNNDYPDTLIATILRNTTQAWGSGILPIPQQHNGNCASDTIQIILMYADIIRDYSLEELFAWIRDDQRIPDASNPPYIHYKYRMFVRFVNIFTKPSANRPRIDLPVLRRAISKNNSGEHCSAWIARSMYPTAQISRTNTRSWAYSLAGYAPILRQLLPSAVSFSNNEVIPGMPIVAIQYFLFDSRRGIANFHTFCAFRMNGQWFIGDNMMGIAEPLPHGIREYDLITTTMYHYSQNLGDRHRYTYRLYDDIYSDRADCSVIESIAPRYSITADRLTVHPPYGVRVCENKAYRLYYQARPRMGGGKGKRTIKKKRTMKSIV